MSPNPIHPAVCLPGTVTIESNLLLSSGTMISRTEVMHSSLVYSILKHHFKALCNLSSAKKFVSVTEYFVGIIVVLGRPFAQLHCTLYTPKGNSIRSYCSCNTMPSRCTCGLPRPILNENLSAYSAGELKRRFRNHFI